MNLRQLIDSGSLNAGGPGSGPHKGTGGNFSETHRPLRELMKVARNIGYKVHSRNHYGMRTMVHPDGSKLHLHRSGKWTAPSRSSKSGKTYSGKDSGSLNTHLNKVHQKD